ncbi:hypothetical protein RhiirA5_414866 [Rhizophagus irregularis]|uniref:Uncharacterized protein n=1 Tax=Rhizophagus irregularis TaxID=588596 RepID=A0A2I1FGC9_9GLOM|nr:hypothetical protein RhiirA5_414866 [Rhizophagus irregularis]PKC75429.1 hypothetical protein RhiirA1_448816 [Rhizophagus irregularis]PKY33452.1 hypothetical protein RhiirB3_452354 [Rhizophagus irregularis]CAB5217208.1 unnamed protein product [Rhizophagus irregularis]CAB5388134.1 unnamed protein product [Rhizophagus irregularis]
MVSISHHKAHPPPTLTKKQIEQRRLAKAQEQVERRHKARQELAKYHGTSMSNFAKRRRKAAILKQHEELNEQIANFSPLHIENPVEDYGWSDCYPASVTSEDTKQLETRVTV